MDLRQHLRLMAAYHAWATQRLCMAVDAVPEADYRRDLGLFFKSLHATLNHLLLVDEIWQARLCGTVFPVSGLDQELEPDRGRLRQRLLDFVRGWPPFVDKITPTQIAGDLDYRSLKGDPFTMPFASLVLHVFNHGTHHRGQITAGLTRLGAESPVLDLPFYLSGLPRDRLHG